MIREMTLGQYYKADSVLHKLDARVKLLGTLLFVITLFSEKLIKSWNCNSISCFHNKAVKSTIFYDDSRCKTTVCYYLFFSDY